MTTIAATLFLLSLSAALAAEPGTPAGQRDGAESAPPAAAAAAASPPGLRLPDTVRPRRYAVELEIDPGRERFDGAIAIDLDLAVPTDLVWLNATGLGIDSVELTAGEEALPVPASAVPGGEDFLGIRAERAIGPGPARLRLEFHGTLAGSDTHGLFRQKEGEDWYVFSQLESHYARRAFPCFDEPSFKVPWQLTLIVPKGAVAVSNTAARAESELADGRRRVAFAETLPLPSYLVALAVGPFDVAASGDGEQAPPMRILTPRGRAAESRYPAEITRAILTRLEAYFGMPYPYDKLDQVAIPITVGFGAMENPGLVTYSLTGLLSTAEDLSIGQRRRLAGTIAHELAHQWFGDLVTLAWWDDTWLNEAFATWMGGKVVDEWKPEWDQKVARAQSRSRAISSDSLASARRIRQPVSSKDDIRNAFDGITYGKGAAVLSMFEAWMGEERFRLGVRRYLRAHAHGNATADDFLAALAAEGGEEAAAALATFLHQPGVPLVGMELVCAEGAVPRVALTQKRFLPTGSRGSTDQTWQVPVCVRYGGADGGGRACTLLPAAAGELELAGAKSCPEWLLGNEAALGYYLVSYRGDLLARLIDVAGRELTLPERVALLADVRDLVEAGELEMAEALALVPRFAGDVSRHIVSSVAGIAAGVSDDLVAEALRPNYARFVRRMFGDRARDLGYRARPGEDEDTMLMRERVVGLVADEGEDRKLGAEARRLALAWLEDRRAVAPEMVDTVLAVAAQAGDRQLFERFRAVAGRTEDRRDRRRLLGAMGSFRDPKAAAAALALVLDDDFDVRESGTILRRALADPATRAQAWEFFKRNYDAYVARIPPESGAGLAAYAGAFCDEEGRRDAEAFLGGRLEKFTGAPRALEQALERSSLCIAEKQAQQASVARFLERY